MAKVIIDRYGRKLYLNDEGLLHRDDGPAEISKDGTFGWYTDGHCNYMYHRDGEKFYYGTGFLGLIKETFPTGYRQRWKDHAVVWPDYVELGMING